MTHWHVVAAIAVSFAVTFSLRGLPFLLPKSKRESRLMEYLGVTMPAGIMLILVIYSLQTIADKSLVAAAIGVIVTAGLHLWKGQALISIAVGVLVYGGALALLPF